MFSFYQTENGLFQKKSKQGEEGGGGGGGEGVEDMEFPGVSKKYHAVWIT